MDTPPPLLQSVIQDAPAAELTFHGWVALVTTGLVLAGMFRRNTPVDFLFVAGLTVVTLAGVISPEEALAGFASKAVVLIGALFAASAGLRTTGALDWVGNKLLGSAETERGALVRLAAAVVPSSAFVLNTPLVAMMAPVVVDWCRKRSISPSRVLIPLSYLTICGGVATVIGTSTTLVINGQLSKLSLRELSFFEISMVGVPIALLGAVYVIAAMPRRLPNRTDLIEDFGERRREYLVEMQVLSTCPLIGKTVQEAGLRNLPGLFLIEIDRDNDAITPVSPRDVLHAGDRLVFTGVVTTIADLERIPGLVPAVDNTYETAPKDRIRRTLTEAVLSRTSPLIGKTIRDAQFRRRYNAAVVAVHRNGERLTNKIGTIALEAGDTLLLQTRNEFAESHRHSSDFYLVSRVGQTTARRHDRALMASLLFAGLILWLTIASLLPGAWAEWGNLAAPGVQAIAAVAVVVAMVGARCMNTSEARSAIDLQVLITIAAALGLGQALSVSGAAAFLANSLVSSVDLLHVGPGLKPLVLLAIVYVVSQILTEVVTNVAVASIMITVAASIATLAGYDPRPFIVAVTLAASLSFVTPIGYQTNLMVMGPGGYQPLDYWRAGWPLALLLTIAAMVLIPLAFPFSG
ncbi:MAG: SLC13 family permease [Planctomycetota bacterium]